MSDDYGMIITGVSALETELRDLHPRLHLREESLTQWRQQYRENPATFEPLINQADQAAQQDLTSLSGDLRGVSETLPTLALAWHLTGNDAYLAGAQAWLRAYAKVPDGELISGHTLYGMAIALDWLHQTLPLPLRSEMQAALKARAARMQAAFANHAGWERDVYCNNHIGVALAGFVAACGYLYGLEPEIGPWWKLALEKLRAVSQALGPDGVSPEGISYGEYYFTYLVRALDIAESLVGLRLLGEQAWFRGFGYFNILSALPPSHWQTNDCQLHFGDGENFHWYVSASIDRVAQAVGDDTLHAYAQLCRERQINHFTFTDILWRKETRAALAWPVFHHFSDHGYVFLREDWDTEPAPTVQPDKLPLTIAFKCGPFCGHYALTRYSHDIAGGHMHPDAGSFQIVAGSDRLITDDRYSYKDTTLHNVFTVDGVGQTGERSTWFESITLRRDQRGPTIKRAVQTPEGAVIEAQLAPAYEPECGLRQADRRIQWRRPGTIILEDQLLTEQPKPIDWFFHSAFPWRETDAGAWIVSGKQAQLRLTLRGESFSVSTTLTPEINTDGKSVNGHLQTLRIRHPGSPQPIRLLAVLEVLPIGEAFRTKVTPWHL